MNKSDSDSDSDRDTHQIAKSSTKSDRPMESGILFAMSFIIRAKRATLKTPPWGTPLSWVKLSDRMLSTTMRRWALGAERLQYISPNLTGYFVPSYFF